MKAGVLRDVWTAVQPDPNTLNKVIDGLASGEIYRQDGTLAITGVGIIQVAGWSGFGFAGPATRTRSRTGKWPRKAVAVARKLVRGGADALIIEGMEAGGHIGPVSTSVLAQEILPIVSKDIPVFVAGGIGRGEAIAAGIGPWTCGRWSARPSTASTSPASRRTSPKSPTSASG